MSQKTIIQEQLEAMGFELTTCGNIGSVFEYEGMKYLLVLDEDDEHFLRIAVPDLLMLTEDNHDVLQEVIHEAAQILKYSKICIRNESVWILYDHYLNLSEDLRNLLEHIIYTLDHTIFVFMKIVERGDEIEHMCESAEYCDDALEAKLQEMFDNLDDEELD